VTAECFAFLSHHQDVCPSAHPSVTLRYCVKTRQARITKSSLWAATRTRVYRDKFCALDEGVPLERGSQRGVPPVKRRHFAAVGSYSVKMVADRYRHAAYHNEHWQQAFYIRQFRWPWTPKMGVLVNFFGNFWLQHTIYVWVATKWLEINQDNLRIKFPALNADFSSPSSDRLSSRRPACASVKKAYPLKRLFYRYWLV